jgi:glucose 1-dehydrogenase
MPETMRAIGVTPAKREVALLSLPAPTITTDTQVKLRILEVGVCGTDREIAAFEYGTPPDGSESLVLGHESLGEVVEVGAGVKSLRPGDLAVPSVRRPCPHAHCRSCRAGRQDFCLTGDFVERGIKQAHGFMTEHVVDEERYLTPVPPGLRDVAVLVEPLTVAEKSLIQLRPVQSRLPWTCEHAKEKGFGHCHRALVLGAGPVGLLGAMALIVEGFETYVYSRDLPDAPKAKLTRSFGAQYVSAQIDPLPKLGGLGGTIDVIYEALGSSKVSFDSMGALGESGVCILTGVPALKDPIQVDTDRLMRDIVLKNQVILGTVNAGKDAFEGAIRDLTTFTERWPDSVRALITTRHPVENYRELLLGKTPGVKHVISFA